MRKLSFLLVFGIFLLTGCSEAVDMQEEMAIDLRGHDKPLKFEANGTIGRTSVWTSPDCAGWRTSYSGSAEVKRYGTFDVVTDECETYDPVTQYYTAEGTVTFTSVNTGEQVYIDIVSHAGPANADNIASITGTWTITGGTGQFSGATGSGIITGTQYAGDNYPVTFFLTSKENNGGKILITGQIAEVSSEYSGTPECPGWLTSYAGSASESKLGIFEVVTNECMTYDPSTQVFTSDGTSTFTQQGSGDKLYVSFLMHAGPSDPAGVAEVYGDWTIMGGTGQFSGASGSGVLTGTQVTDGDYPITFTMEGVLTFL